MKNDRWFKFLAVLIGVALVLYVASFVYGIIAYFKFIPDLEKQVAHYHSNMDKYAAQNIDLKRKVEDLQFRVRWSNFLGIMLDRDSKVQFDNLEEYLVKNRNGLYNRIPKGE